jgi:hypothetical protein
MENINIMDDADNLTMCTCHFCGTRFYSTTVQHPQIGVFCSEECLDLFCEETVKSTQNILDAIKSLVKNNIITM